MNRGPIFRAVALTCFSFFVDTTVIQSAELERLVELEKQFEEKKAALDLPGQNLDAQYGEELEALEKKAQASANLDLVLAIRDEAKNFSERKTLSSPSRFDELARIQKIYEAQKVRSAEQRTENLLPLVDEYRRQLVALKNELTKAGNIEGAVAVRSRIERMDETSPSLVKPLRGRYVRIDIPRKASTLQFAELEVFDRNGKNLALEGNASLSGKPHPDGGAKNGIDGNPDGEIAKGSLVLAEGAGGWWELDLLGEKEIARLVFWSRNKIQSRMDGMRISVLDARKKVVWEKRIPRAPRRELEIRLSAD